MKLQVTTPDREDKLRKARSLNDIVAVIREIGKEVYQTSTSAGKKPIEDEEITIDHTGTAPLKVGNKGSGGVSLKVQKFVVPPAATLQKQSEALQSLYDNGRDLDSAESLLLNTFAKAKSQPAALKAIRTLKAEIQSKIDLAFTTLSELADKHIPPEMEDFADKIGTELQSYIDTKSYEDLSASVYVAPADGNTNLFHFCYYFTFTNLKNTHGFIFEEYCVILTGIISKEGSIKYFLNALPEFKIPGSYPIGKQVNNVNDVKQRVKLLIAHNDIVSEHDRLPLSIDDARAKTAGFTKIPNVLDAYVQDDALYLKITRDTPSAINKVMTEVIPLLNMILGVSKNKKSVLSYKTIKAAKGKGKVIQIILTPTVRMKKDEAAKHINIQKLEDLQHMLDLSDEELATIKKALKQHI